MVFKLSTFRSLVNKSDTLTRSNSICVIPVLIFICFVHQTLYSQNRWPQGWPRTYGGTLSENLRLVVKLQEGGFLLIGESESLDGDLAIPSNEYRSFAAKINAIGDIEWTSFSDAAWIASAKSYKNGYLLLGSTRAKSGQHKSNGYSDVFIRMLNNSGDVLWTRVIGSSGDEVIQQSVYGMYEGITESSSSLVITDDGGIVVTGYFANTDHDFAQSLNQSGIFFVKLDANGNFCPLAITIQPESISVSGGQRAVLSVKAISTSAVSFQWQRNDGSGWLNLVDDNDYAGSTTASLTVKAAKRSKKGPYRCAVSAEECTLISNEALLNVICPCNE